MAEIRDLFRKQFSYLPAHIVRAPAAIELIGAGSALRHGLAISATLDCHVEIACAPRSDGKCCLTSGASRQIETFRPDTFVSNLAAPWAEVEERLIEVIEL